MDCAGTTPPKCVSWVEHPLYFLADRWEPHNVWHGLEDVAHAFETYSLLGWGQDAQVRFGGEGGQAGGNLPAFLFAGLHMHFEA